MRAPTVPETKDIIESARVMTIEGEEKVLSCRNWSWATGPAVFLQTGILCLKRGIV